MNNEMIFTFARQVILLGGGYLVTTGLLTEADLTTGGEAIITLATLIYGLWQKREAGKIAMAATVPNATAKVATAVAVAKAS